MSDISASASNALEIVEATVDNANREVIIISNMNLRSKAGAIAPGLLWPRLPRLVIRRKIRVKNPWSFQ